tara:strand:+ start:522 stop:737 length:216 start_codon:yes stop_codon:yes gene_type:complete
MENLKLVHQLFIGKVADEIGMERTTELLKEAKEAFAIPVVVKSFVCEQEENRQGRCETQCLGCDGLQRSGK